MLSVPNKVKRSEEYSKAHFERNRYFQKYFKCPRNQAPIGPNREGKRPREPKYLLAARRAQTLPFPSA